MTGFLGPRPRTRTLGPTSEASASEILAGPLIAKRMGPHWPPPGPERPDPLKTRKEFGPRGRFVSPVGIQRPVKNLGGGNSNIFGIFTPKIGEDDSHFDEHIFQRGWFNRQLEKVCGLPENQIYKLIEVD